MDDEGRRRRRRRGSSSFSSSSLDDDDETTTTTTTTTLTSYPSRASPLIIHEHEQSTKITMASTISFAAGCATGHLDRKYEYESSLTLYVNARKFVIRDAQPEETLLTFLRRAGLTGTKLGCGEGGCGACTVMVSQRDPVTLQVEHRSLNACLAPLCSMDSAHILTVEGIASVRRADGSKGPHPVQERIAKFHGSQCGFCTPGIVMSLYTLLRNNPKPTLHDIEESFDGNLCRCTGYRPILDAAKTFASDKDKCGCPNAERCGGVAAEESDEGRCQGHVVSGKEGEIITTTTRTKAVDSGKLSLSYEEEGVQEPSFPHELTEKAVQLMRPLKIVGERVTWYRPVTLEHLLELQAAMPKAKIVAGNTEVGIETKFKHREYSVLISNHAVPQLRQLSIRPTSEGGALVIGGAVTLSSLERFLLHAFEVAGVAFEPHSEDGVEEEKACNGDGKVCRGDARACNGHSDACNGDSKGCDGDADGCHHKEKDRDCEGDACAHAKNADDCKLSGCESSAAAAVGSSSLPPLKAHETRGWQTIVHMMQWFASNQIRNVAAVAGNVVTASPISDLNPVLMALGAQLRLASASTDEKTDTTVVSTRMVPIREFFLGYRKTALKPGEVLLSIEVPRTEAGEYVRAYKQARRRDDDISITNACFRVGLDLSGDIKGQGMSVARVTSMSACYGGLAAITKPAKALESAIVACERWGAGVVQKGLAAVRSDFDLPASVPGGMPGFRMALAASFFYKFYLSVCQELQGGAGATPLADASAKDNEELGVVGPREASGSRTFLTDPRPVSQGVQCFQIPKGGMQRTRAFGGDDHEAAEKGKDKGGDAPAGNRDNAPVGQPLPHAAGLLQCTGEARYVDDMPSPPGTLHLGLVLSTRPLARIVSLDVSAAREAEGVVRIFTAADPSDNSLGAIEHDEELFRRETVTSTGQPIAAVVADTQANAQRAARLVKVEYGSIENQDDAPVTGAKDHHARANEVDATGLREIFSAGKPIISIDDAIAARSFHPTVRVIQCGDKDVETVLADAEVVVEGEMRVGGQEHFYLECNGALAVPGECGELTVFASTQNAMKTQTFAAKACGLDCSRVVCRVKRMGGGFGGKETRSVWLSSIAALAAVRLGRPVRSFLDRNEDMWATGGRHPFLGKYRVGATRDGRIIAADVHLYSNAGYSLDLSGAVMERGLFHIDNTYNIPNLRVTGTVCLTNTVTNSAFRGFGGPQGMIVCEAFVDHVAAKLSLTPEVVRAKNLYGPETANRTHFGQIIEANPLPRLLRQLRHRAHFTEREAAVREFNKKHRWRKRGITMLQTKFGIAFTATFMNQAGALVNIYTDGTVLVTHGGTEMGQGLHTKVMQIAARALDIDMGDVTVTETATDKVPNASPTAASASSDMYGMAVLHACEQLALRLKAFRTKAEAEAVEGESKRSRFKKAVLAAYFARVNLSAQGFYKTPVSGYNWDLDIPLGGCNSKRGKPFAYFTFGGACSEVEIDVLTGDLRVLRADIVMDVGNSLNPAIDIGQIEGAFTQGMGLTTMEEVVWAGPGEIAWLPSGVCFTQGPGTYKIPSFNDVPVDFRVTLLRDSANAAAVHSSRAIGEPPLFLGSSVFFATKQAVRAARADAGHKVEENFELHSPLTAERIRMACGDPIAVKAKMAARPKGFW